jgi:putative PIG3 family NAD(P)H quinone oxidoreductase
MFVMRVTRFGPPETLQPAERAVPGPGPEDLLVRVRAVGVNRADCLQRAGTYPTPPGVDWGDVPGLELAGEVAEVGAGVGRFQPGDRVFGLVANGAYAEYALIDQGLALPVPKGWSFVDAACIIEVFATANETVFELGQLAEGQTILIHAGASGVGTAALQMAVASGARAIATAGSEAKTARLRELGATLAINYRQEDFVVAARRLAGERGVDVIIDFIGADYLARNLELLALKGRLVLVGLMGGPTCVFDPAILLRKRLTVRGFTLRSQSVDEKRAIVGRVRERWLPLLEAGQIRPVLHGTMPLGEASAAHALLESNQTIGKVVLEVGTD